MELRMQTKVRVQVDGLNTYHKDWPVLWEMIIETAKGVSFPCLCDFTGRHGDLGDPIIRLPNGETISSRFLQIAC